MIFLFGCMCGGLFGIFGNFGGKGSFFRLFFVLCFYYCKRVLMCLVEVCMFIYGLFRLFRCFGMLCIVNLWGLSLLSFF